MQKKAGPLGVRGVPPPPPEVTATLLKQHHQSSISCHGPKLGSEQIHVSGKGQILAEPALAQLDILPLTLCQERAALISTPSMPMTESMRSSFMTCSPAQRPLLTWVGPPPSITHYERLPYQTGLSKKLSGELTRRASSGQLDLALCHNWHVQPRTMLPKRRSSVSGHTLTRCHRGSRSQEPFPIFRLPKIRQLFKFCAPQASSWPDGWNNAVASFS